MRSSEWVLVGSLLLFCLSLFCVAQGSAAHSRAILATPPESTHALLPVQIDGAVKKPGIYPTLPGTPLKKVIMKSKPSRFADLKQLDLEARVEGPLTLHLTELTEIVIRVEGAVLTPCELTLPTGTRVKDLRAHIALQPDADLSLFKSRRLLKDGEIFQVLQKRD